MSQPEDQKLRALIDSFANEKKLISYEMHDGLLQLLIGSLMQLESINRSAVNLDSQTLATLESAIGVLREAIGTGRQLIGDLCASSIESDDLTWELEQLVDAFSTRPPLVYSRLDIDWAGTDPLVNGTIYGVVKESLNNVKKHSQAEAVWVSVEARGGDCKIIIVDNGKGSRFDQCAGRRFGIQGIKERSSIFGGEACFFSAKTDATEFEAKVTELSRADVFFAEAQRLVSGFIVQAIVPWVRAQKSHQS